MRELREILGLNRRTNTGNFLDFKRQGLGVSTAGIAGKNRKIVYLGVGPSEGRGGKVTGIRFVFDEDNEDHDSKIRDDEIPASGNKNGTLDVRYCKPGDPSVTGHVDPSRHFASGLRKNSPDSTKSPIFWKKSHIVERSSGTT
ncbi:MAG: hypothetical protein V9G98_27860 [Candidatus Competibacter sp.]